MKSKATIKWDNVGFVIAICVMVLIVFWALIYGLDRKNGRQIQLGVLEDIL